MTVNICLDLELLDRGQIAQNLYILSNARWPTTKRSQRNLYQLTPLWTSSTHSRVTDRISAFRDFLYGKLPDCEISPEGNVYDVDGIYFLNKRSESMSSILYIFGFAVPAL